MKQLRDNEMHYVLRDFNVSIQKILLLEDDTRQMKQHGKECVSLEFSVSPVKRGV